MSLEQPLVPDQPKPFDQLFKESFALYKVAWLPMVTIAAIGSLAANTFLAFWTPTTTTLAVVWLVAAQVPTLLAEASLITMAWRVERGEPPTISTAFATALALGPRYVVGRVLIGLILSLGIATIIGIPIALFLFARWGLFGPDLVVNQRSTVQSLRASWNLVTNKTLRTLGMLAIMQLAVFSVSFIVQGLVGDGSLAIQVLLATLGQAAVIPLATTFTLLLYEDYIRLAHSNEL